MHTLRLLSSEGAERPPEQNKSALMGLPTPGNVEPALQLLLRACGRVELGSHSVTSEHFMMLYLVWAKRPLELSGQIWECCWRCSVHEESM